MTELCDGIIFLHGIHVISFSGMSEVVHCYCPCLKNLGKINTATRTCSCGGCNVPNHIVSAFCCSPFNKHGSYAEFWDSHHSSNILTLVLFCYVYYHSIHNRTKLSICKRRYDNISYFGHVIPGWGQWGGLTTLLSWDIHFAVFSC